ncbi:hypothetical protein PCANC_23935 [Puccinia coronata f. sp. avenae]|uniref:OTU domain-containing protein n=1 Tax=Puccinia coronata f. sp. avenae TaxID=200324 RepID=A0A2N5S758_9BASI|nr:hypothetical protein PCANC_23935 [Puccinia coronata f. sp. avenae]
MQDTLQSAGETRAILIQDCATCTYLSQDIVLREVRRAGCSEWATKNASSSRPCFSLSLGRLRSGSDDTQPSNLSLTTNHQWLCDLSRPIGLQKQRSTKTLRRKSRDSEKKTTTMKARQARNHISPPRPTHRNYPILLKSFAWLICSILLILKMEAMELARPTKIISDVFKTGPVGTIHQFSDVQDLEPVETLGRTSEAVVMGYPARSGQTSERLRQGAPSRLLDQHVSTTTGLMNRIKQKIIEVLSELKIRFYRFLRGPWSQNHRQVAPLSSPQSSGKLDIEPALEQLNGRRIIVNHPELIKPWVPIDFLPGYESTQNFIGKDGKCLFRAFAHLKYGQQDLYEQVWDEIIEYMRANVDHFGPFMTGDESNHMKVQRRIAELEGGAWGDHVEITAFVELTKLNLIVISKAERSVNVEVFTSKDASDIYNAVLLESEHYELARQAPSLRPSY